MSTDKLKKQSKNLLRLFPDFIRDHGSELRLADCQELVARLNGYPNWHAAMTRAGCTSQEPVDRPVQDFTPTITEEDGHISVQLPGSNRTVSVRGTSPEQRQSLLDHVRELHEQEQRRRAAREDGVPALLRLFEVARGNTGQCRRVAAFLLGLYNGSRFPFDLTDLRAVDQAIFEDCMKVLRMDASPEKEVHQYVPGGGELLNRLAADWRIPDIRRLLLIAGQLQNTGVASFGGEGKLNAEIGHAVNSTWPPDSL